MLARVQFGLTIAFHYLFVPLTLGLIVAIAAMDSLFAATGQPRWRQAARFWYRFFLLAWLVGMATGYPLRMQLEQQWSAYSDHAREVIHAVMGVEGVIAPVMIALVALLAFLGHAQPALDRAITRWCLAAVMLVQAACIVTLNAWMQNPVGTRLGSSGVEIVSLREIFLSATAIDKVAHTLSAAMLTGAVFIAALSSFYLLRKRHVALMRSCLALALPMALAALAAVIWSGHASARGVMTQQPMKFAAIEAHWDHDGGPTGLTLFAIPDADAQANRFSLSVPRLMSWLATHSDAPVRGIRELLADAESQIEDALRAGEGGAGAGWRQLYRHTAQTHAYWEDLTPRQRMSAAARASLPSVAILFTGFRLMVGSALVLAVVLGWALIRRRSWLDAARPWPLRLLCICLPLPWLATLAGWTVAEVGRQPWVIYEQMTTATAATLAPISVGALQLLAFTGAYLLVGAGFCSAALWLLRAGPRRYWCSLPWRRRLQGAVDGMVRQRSRGPAAAVRRA